MYTAAHVLGSPCRLVGGVRRGFTRTRVCSEGRDVQIRVCVKCYDDHTQLAHLAYCFLF